MRVSLKKFRPKRVEKWRKDPKEIGKFRFAYHFLPHPVEKKRATLLSLNAYVVYILLIVALMIFVRIIPLLLPGVLGYASSISIKDLLRETNSERARLGLLELRLNEKLTFAAQDKAAHMFKNNYWAHSAPDGTEPWDFILGQNYDYIYAGENLAKNFNASSDVVRAWMESPSHRENLVNKNYQEVGFAVINGVLNGYETTLVVQMFGKPREASMLASKADEAALLKQITPEAAYSEVKATQNSQTFQNTGTSRDFPFVDISVATRVISVTFASFLFVLLLLDIWYSKRKGILKFTGHNVAHIAVLFIVVISIWFVLKPGKIL